MEVLVDLSRVNAIVKTFLRDEHMMKCVESIERHYPQIQIVLVDDGYITSEKKQFYKRMRNSGHIVEENSLAFDSGFGAKSNLAAALCTRPYILTANDDFLFDGDTDGVKRMVTLLDNLHPGTGLVCGTWNGIDYQGYLKRTAGRVEEIPLPRLTSNYDLIAGVRFRFVDLCAVYGIFKREVFSKTGVRWDARYKIGGEHGDWFMDIHDAGWSIAFCPDANICEVTGATEHPDYKSFRYRHDWQKHYREKHGPHTYKYFSGREEVFK